MDARAQKIDEIFTRGRRFEIPFFQRSYVWVEDNWERFLDDISASASECKEYFMGALIFKQQETPSTHTIGDVRKIIDGQQRITTLLIFLKVLCKKNNKAHIFSAISKTFNEELCITHNHIDNDIFKAILTDSLTDVLLNKYKENNVYKCYNYFESKTCSENISLDHVLRYLYFVVIDLSAKDDEQQIFDTINTLGVKLTTSELLKNELYSNTELNFYEKTWKHTFEAEQREYWLTEFTVGKNKSTLQELFLRSFYYLKVPAGDSKNLASMFSNYKTYIKKHAPDKHLFIQEMMEVAEIFKPNFTPDILNVPLEKASPIQHLNIILFAFNTTTIIPYVLFLCRHVADDEERNKMFSLLESYIIRRRICNLTEKRYNLQFSSFIKANVLTYNELLQRLSSNTEPTSKFPNDEDVFNSFLYGDRNFLNNKLGALILYLLELSQRDEKDTTCLAPYSAYSLEHLMPKKWRNKWFEDKRPLSDEEINTIDKHVGMIGNFTIIRQKLNSSLSDDIWECKLDGKNRQNGLREHSQGIRTFAKCLNMKDWNCDEIRKRTMEIARLCIIRWENPSSPLKPSLSSMDLEDRRNAMCKLTSEGKEFELQQLLASEREINDEQKELALKLAAAIMQNKNSKNKPSPIDTAQPFYANAGFTSKKPAYIIFKKKQHAVESWRDLLIVFMSELHKEYSTEIAKIASRREYRELSDIVREQTRKENWYRLNDNIYVYINLSAESITAFITRLLSVLSIQLEELEIYLKR